MEQLLRSDIAHLRHLRESRIEQSCSRIAAATGDLPLPSLTVIGTHPDISSAVTTGLVYELVRAVAADQRGVILASGRETTFRTRAECLLGRPQLGQLLREPPSIDTDELTLAGLERYGSTGLRLETYGCESDMCGILRLADRRRARPLSLLAVDDIGTVEGLTAGAAEAVTPASLRIASRKWSTAVVVTTSWTHDDPSRWVRYADQVLEVLPDELGDAVLTGGMQDVNVEAAGVL